MSAPEIYTKAINLVDLWTLKARLGAGRPFDADRDIVDVAMDIINAASFGLDDDLSMVKHQLNSLTTLSDVELPTNADGAVEFTHPPDVTEIAAIHEIAFNLGEQFKSIFPRFSHYYRLLTNPAFRKAIAVKDEFIYNEIEKALERYRSGNEHMRSAMDHVLQREMNAARKAGRQPVFHSPRIHDEVGRPVSVYVALN